jgi:hypothetical protein
MLNQQTIEKLAVLKLNGMADNFTLQLQQPKMNDLSFEDRFAMIVTQARKILHTPQRLYS